VLPDGRRVVIRKGSWPTPPVFGWLQKLGGVSDAEMFRVFIMGVGFVLIVSRYYTDSVVRRLEEEGFPAYVIGEVTEGDKGVDLA
jgi:phosphoribosylformylglycinamidine cyclo-ligase